MSSQLVDELRKIPPVTRTLCASTAVVTLPILLGLTTFRWIILTPDYIFTTPPQIWRLYTSFFFAGKGLQLLFNVIMLYQYSNDLENVRYHRRSPDYAWQLAICGLGIIGLNIPLGNIVFFNAFLVTIVYLSCRLSPNKIINLFGIIQVPSLYYPFVMVALDLIVSGRSSAIHSMTGLIAGHGWWLFEWREIPGQTQRASRWGRAPGWLRNLIGEGEVAAQAPGAAQRSFGTAIAPAGRGLNDGGQGASTATTGHNWGSGRRLGTE